MEKKNIKFLKEIIRTYQSMTMDVDVVVYSDAPKDVDASVKVIVGLQGRILIHYPLRINDFLRKT